jgi:hypothetical protein
MGHRADLERARGHYLFSCGLALVAAVVGIAVPAAADGAERGPRLELVLVGLAAIGIFAWVFVRARSDESMAAPPGSGRTPRRLRKMSFLWLGLAAALGVSVMRTPVGAVIDGTTESVSPIGWLGLVAGLAISIVTVWRFAGLLRERTKDE